MSGLRYAIVILGGVVCVPGSGDAAIISATYSVQASMFEDSANNPPTGPSTTSIDGQFRFTFDSSIRLSTHVPDAISGIEITNNDGVLNVYDPTSAGVHTFVDFAPNMTRVSFGGNQGTPQFMGGLSDDFRVIFDISTLTGEVEGVFDNFSYVTTQNPFLDAQATTVSLIDFSPVTADLDSDGDVDGTDFLLIQRNNPSLIPLWQAQYGANPLVASVALPEPTTLTCFALAICLHSLARLRKVSE